MEIDSSRKSGKMRNFHILFNNKSYHSLVTQALSKIPEEIVDNVEKDCLFIPCRCFLIDAEACYIPNEWINDKYLILLSDSLESDRQESQKTVLHEVAHYFLGHKTENLNVEPSDEQREKDEREANELVELWLNQHN